ncbi:hypothetical protein AEAC466_10715 [Asticcacaulis sp. AC466]|uniref:Atxe2 family lasso peptide isopeptidase n=1 Tax=Asticcacaulis sp. AC466 TaxID=1282362 RepID=UPI0003C3C83C|nr:Atxe2 family lasso peptide isopeptidase [Asticcacaulis sp. AC466]ESQ84208.1 hypothetical protein AEAC466_10715 [Asticcacaulis sp. AC466]
MRITSFVSPTTLLVGLILSTGGVAKSAPCTNLLPESASAGGAKRPIVADDLLRLRDIGPKHPSARDPILSLSPDGTRVAFQLRRADPETDAYCLGMVVMPLTPGGKPTVVDIGGDYIRVRQEIGTLTNGPSGYTEIITPKWSPDGKVIAFKRSDNSTVQAWIAVADGGGSRSVSHLPFDVEDIAWTPDGLSLILTGRPGLEDAKRAIQVEGENGYLFDDRFVPFDSNAPWRRNNIPRQAYVVNVATGEARLASGTEVVDSLATQPTAAPATALNSVSGPSGKVAWTELSDPNNVASPERLGVSGPNGKIWTCAAKVCAGARAIWWRDEETLVFQKLEGWARSETGLYEWTIRSGKVRQILKTQDLIAGCQIGNGVLVCAHEAKVQPRDIVQIDLPSGRLETLFDPNPDYKAIAFGPVKRLQYVNSFGVEGFADLVLPSNRKPGEKVPLVVVQYLNRGFLRGGINDEAPILLFAANDMAVLSFEDYQSPGSIKGGSSWDAITAYDRIDWRGHRSTQELLELAIKQSVATGAIDEKRLGITGISAGSNNTRWALLNSDLFSAAVIGSCCEDMTSIFTVYGEQGGNEMRRYGYPGLTADGKAFWAPFSMRLNASRMKTPLLMELADHEYLASLESYFSLKEQTAPVEMYVFPDEFHEKWHPIHRRALYARNIDWLKFWLLSQEDDNPAKQEQYKRWRSLRANLPGSGAPKGD